MALRFDGVVVVVSAVAVAGAGAAVTVEFLVDPPLLFVVGILALLLAVGGAFRRGLGGAAVSLVAPAAGAAGGSWLSSFIVASKSEFSTGGFWPPTLSTRSLDSILVRLDRARRSSTSVDASLSLEELLEGSAMVFLVKKGLSELSKKSVEKKKNEERLISVEFNTVLRVLFFWLSDRGLMRWRCME